jgi:tetratricopeptide (TPR) repeat protein/tRNA A-37 threonylcarbamoyl transferase component Bud32
MAAVPPKDADADAEQQDAPRTFAGYEIFSEIGRGGMGVVYKARDPHLKRTVALKVLLGAEHASKEEVARFYREAKSAARLHHPNIVPIHELRKHKGRHYYTMDYVDGQPLDELIADGELEPRERMEILEKVARGLDHAHAHGVIHRDLKPANIVIDSEGEPQVMDFGLAKLLVQGEDGASREGLTQSGVAMGTPHYMAPEQAAGLNRQVDARTDVYALGCIAYELLTGQPPFIDESSVEILRKQIEEDPPAPGKRGSKLTGDVETICLKCLEKDPDRRYASAGELADDLRRFLGGETVNARRASVAYVVKKKVLRNKLLFAVVTAGCALLMAATVWYVVSLRKERNRALTELDARKQLEHEKRQREHKVRLEAGKAVVTGLAALEESTRVGGDAEREKLLVEAQASFRRALFLTPKDAQAREGMRRASLRHFEMARIARNWRQAWEKLEQARQTGLRGEHYETHMRRLEEARTARERFVAGRVKALMADAAKLDREVPHEMALRELISLRGKLAVDGLVPYVRHAHPGCRELAVESLGWMGDLRAVKAILPYIQTNAPDGKDNPQAVQEAAIRALCQLAPPDAGVYKAIRVRIYQEPRALDSVLYKKVKIYFERYARKMAPVAGSGADDASRKREERAAALCAQGTRHYEARQLGEAISCFDRALETWPGFINAYLQRGNARAAKREFKGAIADYTAALKINPRWASAYLNRGEVKRASGDLDGALADLDTAAGLARGDAGTYSLRGYVKRLMGDVDGAIADFDRALKIDDNRVDVYNKRALAYRAKGHPDRALRDFNKAIELNPRVPEALANRGGLRAAMADFRGAISDYDGAIKLTPRNWRIWALRAIACHALNRGEEFQRSLAAAKKLHPRPATIAAYVKAQGARARSLAEGKQLKGKELTKAGDYFLRASYYYACAQWYEARQDFGKAILLDRSLGEKGGFTALANIAAVRNKHGEKLEAYQVWVKCFPKNPVALNAYAWELLTSKDEERRDAKKALELARKAAELTEQKSAAITDTLALALYENGKLKDALAAAEKAEALLPAGSNSFTRRQYRQKVAKYRKALAAAR